MSDQESKTSDAGISGVGEVVLAVADLSLMIAFYQNVIGLKLRHQTTTGAVIGTSRSNLVVLEAQPGGRIHPEATGLYHLALLVPGRPDLGQWLQHLAESDYPMEGAGDHLVSEALYLRDPEGNGIEIYYDRPRSSWQYVGSTIKMATLAVDFRALLQQATPAPFSGLSDQTRMGHVHLQVNDLDASIRFYRDVIGFDVTSYYPGAGFVSAGGYHHHLGLNVWHSRGASPAPKGSLGLRKYTLMLESQEAMDRMLERIPHEHMAVDESGHPLVRDPSGISFNLAIL